MSTANTAAPRHKKGSADGKKGRDKDAQLNEEDENTLFGVYLFKDGTRYEGEYEETSNGLVRQGHGTLVTSNGYSYTGSWQQDKMHGHGVLTYPSGAVYEGDWKEGKYDGVGTFKFPTGAQYVGEFRDNSMQGSGMYVDPNGERWLGKFIGNVGEGLTIEYA